mmetsp:Transcript_25486/g.71662  ORF Transcript_25486/g.71662 Transcript_25486/m.71662 type:complete len:211 (+) Transcript_25486:226-858(+)
MIRHLRSDVREINRVVERHAIDTRSSQQIQELAVLGMDIRGHVDNHGRRRVFGFDGLHHPLLVRHRERLVLVLGQVPGPRIKHLDDLGALVDLVAGVVADVVRELRQDAVEQLRVFLAHLFDLRKSRSGPRLALDEVRGQREGQAHKPKDRRLVADLFSQLAEDLADERARGGCVELPFTLEFRQVRLRADRRDGDGAAFRDLELDAHGR